MKRVGIRGVRRSAAVRARSRRLTSPLDWRGWQRLDRLLRVERVLAPPSNKRLVNEGELGKAALANLTGGGTILLRPTSSRTPRCPATFPFIGKSTPVPGPNPPPPVCAPASSPECSRAPRHLVLGESGVSSCPGRGSSRIGHAKARQATLSHGPIRILEKEECTLTYRARRIPAPTPGR